MKKKLFVFVLSFALTIGCSAFASCGSSDPLYEELPSYEVVDVNDTTIAKDSSFIDATQIMKKEVMASSKFSFNNLRTSLFRAQRNTIILQ